MGYRKHWLTVATAALLLVSGTGWAQVGIGIGISIRIAPPALPVYVQPAIPAPGYLWVPGYWAWGEDGYYWVPGTWVQPPQVGLLWTPGYWGWSDGIYAWHEGYWGPHVGFYGGVNYGFGYVGVGYAGGYWAHGAFFYNRAVNRIPPSIHVTNVYQRRVVNVTVVNHVSFNGGPGGIDRRPSAQELRFGREPHVTAVAAQRQQRLAAAREPSLRASVNHGRPAIAATSHPGQFRGVGITRAGGAAAHAPGGEHAPHGARGRPAEGPTRNRSVPEHAGPNPRRAEPERGRAAPHASAGPHRPEQQRGRPAPKRQEERGRDQPH